ncbi:MAG: LysR family transcriptional regulator [Xanthobacteraceae bacterium]
MDKLVSIRAFTKVVALGNFSAAARELRLSRSAISKYIADLERDLGVQLLNRTTRSANPTDNGRSYYERCVAILADLEEADRTAAHLQTHARGVLKVNAPMSFGTLYLGKVMPDFMAQHPDLVVQLNLSDQQIDTVQEGFDVTIRIADMASIGLIVRKLAAVERVFCASPRYIKERGVPKVPDDLRQHDCLSYGYLSTGTQWKLTGKDGDYWIHVPWKLCSNNAEVLRDAVVEGSGIALLPTFIAGPDLQSGRLRTVLDGYQAPQLDLCALYPPTQYLPLKVRVFIDFLVGQFARRPGWDQAFSIDNAPQRRAS